MLIPIDNKVFCQEAQDGFDELRSDILSSIRMDKSGMILEDIRSFREDEYLNFFLWIDVFNELDSCMFKIIMRHRDVLFLPFNESVVYNTVPESACIAARNDCPYVKSTDARKSLVRLLHWTRGFVKQSYHRDFYYSLDHLLVCLHAFDDELALVALEVLTELTMIPYNHRKLQLYDFEDLFVKPPFCKEEFYDCFQDVVRAVSSNLLTSDEIASHQKGEFCGEIRSVSEYDLEVTHRPERSRMISSKAGGIGKLGNFIGSPSEPQKVQALEAFLRNEESIASRNEDHREQLRRIDGLFRNHCTNEDSLWLLWSLRMQRLQHSALKNLHFDQLWRVRTAVYQAHHLLLSGHDDKDEVASYYKGKTDVFIEACSMIKLSDDYFENPENADMLQPAFLKCLRWAMVLLGQVTKMRFNENEDSDDDEGSASEKQPSMKLLAPFDSVLIPLGVGTRQMMGLIPSVLRHSITYLLSMPLNESCLPEGVDARTAEERLLHIEQLLLITLHLGELRTAIPTLVENGVIHMLLDAVKPPMLEDVPTWQELSEPNNLFAFSDADTRSANPTVYEFMRNIVDSFASDFLDLVLFKKFARDTYNALHGTEIYVCRLLYEMKVMPHSKPKKCQMPLILSVLTMISHGIYNDGCTDAGDWIRSSAFSELVATLAKNIAIYSVEILSSLITLIDCALEEDPDAGGVVKHMHKSGIIDSLLFGVKSLEDDLSMELLDTLLPFLTHLSHLSNDSIIESIVKKGPLAGFFRLFRQPRALLTESGLFINSGLVGIGEMLHEWSEANPRVRKYLVECLADAYQFFQPTSKEGSKMFLNIDAENDSDVEKWEDASYMKLFDSLLVLTEGLIDADIRDVGTGGFAEYFTAPKPQGLPSNLDKIKVGSMVAHSSPRFFLSCLARWDTLFVENRQCEVESLSGQVIQVMDLLYASAPSRVLDQVQQWLVSTMANLSRNVKNFNSYFERGDELYICDAISDSCASVANCYEKRGNVTLLHLLSDKGKRLLKTKRPSAKLIDSVSREYVSILREITQFWCWLSCLNTFLGSEVHKNYDDESEHLTQITTKIVRLLCENDILGKLSGINLASMKSRIKSQQNHLNSEKGSIRYKLFVHSHIKVKEQPHTKSRTKYAINTCCVLYASRAIEVAGDSTDMRILWYELISGGWISQIKVYRSSSDFLARDAEGDKSAVQVALISVEWDANAIANPERPYSDLECLANVPSALQAGVYAVNSLSTQVEMFLTENTAYIHANLRKIQNPEHVSSVSTVLKIVKETCVNMKTSHMYNAAMLGHSKKPEVSISAPSTKKSDGLGIDAADISRLLQACCIASGVLFGKQLENDMNANVSDINLLSLLTALYDRFNANARRKGGFEGNTLHHILSSTALIFQCCFPCPEYITDSAGIKAWEYRRSAALGAVDEVLHFWYLLLSCSTPFVQHWKSPDSHPGQRERLKKQLKSLSSSNDTTKQNIDMLTVFHDTAALMAKIVLPFLTQPGLGCLPPSILVKVMTCVTHASSCFADIALEHAYMLRYFVRNDDAGDGGKGMVKKTLNEVKKMVKEYREALPCCSRNIREEELLAQAEMPGARGLDKDKRRDLFFEKIDNLHFVEFYERDGDSSRKRVSDKFTDGIIYSDSRDTKTSNLDVWVKDVPIPPKQKYFSGKFAPKFTPARVCFHAKSPPGKKFRERFDGMLQSAVVAAKAISVQLITICSELRNNYFLSPAGSAASDINLDNAEYKERMRALVPFSVVPDVLDMQYDQIFLNIVNCCVAGLANGLQPVLFRACIGRNLSAMADESERNISRETLRFAEEYDYSTVSTTLCNGYRAVIITLCWLSHSVAELMDSLLGYDQLEADGTQAEGADESPEAFQQIEGQLRAFYLLFTLGTNNITLFQRAISSDDHEIFLDSICILWQLHPLLTSFESSLHAFISHLTPISVKSDEKSKSARTLLHLAIVCLDSMTRNIVIDRKIQATMMSLAVVVPCAFSQFTPAPPGIDDPRSARVNFRQLFFPSAQYSRPDHLQRMWKHINAFMFVYTKDEITAMRRMFYIPPEVRGSWKTRWSWTDEFAFVFFMKEIGSLYPVDMKLPSQPDVRVEAHWINNQNHSTWAWAEHHARNVTWCNPVMDSDKVNALVLTMLRSRVSLSAITSLCKLCTTLSMRLIEDTSLINEHFSALGNEKDLLVSSVQCLLHHILTAGTCSDLLDIIADELILYDGLFVNLFAAARLSRFAPLHALASSLLQATNHASSSRNPLLSIEHDAFFALLKSFSTKHIWFTFAPDLVEYKAESGEIARLISRGLSEWWRNIFRRDPLLFLRIMDSQSFVQRLQSTLNRVGDIAEGDTKFDAEVRAFKLSELIPAKLYGMLPSRKQFEQFEVNSEDDDAPLYVSETTRPWLTSDVQRALKQKRLTEELGYQTGTHIVSDVGSFWDSILSDENMSSLGSGAGSSASFKQIDSILAAELLATAEMLHTLTPGSYFWEYFAGVQKGADHSFSANLETNCTSRGPLCAYVIQELVLPQKFSTLRHGDFVESASMVYNFSESHAASLYFVSGCLSHEVISSSTARCIAEGIERMTLDDDPKSCLWQIKMLSVFIRELLAEDELGLRGLKNRHVFDRNMVVQAKLLNSHGFFTHVTNVYAKGITNILKVDEFAALAPEMARFLSTCLHLFDGYVSGAIKALVHHWHEQWEGILEDDKMSSESAQAAQQAAAATAPPEFERSPTSSGFPDEGFPASPEWSTQMDSSRDMGIEIIPDDSAGAQSNQTVLENGHCLDSPIPLDPAAPKLDDKASGNGSADGSDDPPPLVNLPDGPIKGYWDDYDDDNDECDIILSDEDSEYTNLSGTDHTNSDYYTNSDSYFEEDSDIFGDTSSTNDDTSDGDGSAESGFFRSHNSTADEADYQARARTPRSAQRRRVSAAMIPGSFALRSPLGQANDSASRNGRPSYRGYSRRGPSRQQLFSSRNEESSDYEDSSDEDTGVRDYLQEVETDDELSADDSSQWTQDSEYPSSIRDNLEVEVPEMDLERIKNPCSEGLLVSRLFLSDTQYTISSAYLEDMVTNVADCVPNGFSYGSGGTKKTHYKILISSGLTSRTWASDFPVLHRTVQLELIDLIKNYFSERVFDSSNDDDGATITKRLLSVRDGINEDLSVLVNESFEYSQQCKTEVLHGLECKHPPGKNLCDEVSLVVASSMWALSLTLLHPAGEAPMEHLKWLKHLVEVLINSDKALVCSQEPLSATVRPRVPVLILKLLLSVLKGDIHGIRQTIESAVGAACISEEAVRKGLSLRDTLGITKKISTLDAVISTLYAIVGNSQLPLMQEFKAPYVYTCHICSYKIFKGKSFFEEFRKIKLFEDSESAALFERIFCCIIKDWSTLLEDVHTLHKVTKVFWRILKLRMGFEVDSFITVAPDYTLPKMWKHAIVVTDETLDALVNIYISSHCDEEPQIWQRLRKIICFFCGNTDESNAHADVAVDNWRRLRSHLVLPVAKQLTVKIGDEMRHLTPKIEEYLTQANRLMVEYKETGKVSSDFPVCAELTAPSDEIRLTQILRFLACQPTALATEHDPAVAAAIADIQESVTWEALSRNLTLLHEAEHILKTVRGSMNGEKLNLTESSSEVWKPPVAAGAIGAAGSPRRTVLTRLDLAEDDEDGDVQVNIVRIVSVPLMRFSCAIEAYLSVQCADLQLVVPTYTTSPRERVLTMADLNASFSKEKLQVLASADSGTADNGTAEESDDILSSPGLYRQFSVPGKRFRNNNTPDGATGKPVIDQRVLDRLSQFASKNKLLLNARLKQHVKHLEGPLLPMLVLPECRKYLDFSVKRKYMQLCMHRLSDQDSKREREYDSDQEDVEDTASDDSHLSIFVSRDQIFEDSMAIFEETSSKTLRNADLVINFEDEDAIDEGGPTKEWYGLLTKEIFRPHYELFSPTGDGVTYQPNPASAKNEEHLRYFTFVGRLVGRALSDEQVLDIHFTRSFYKHILGQPVSFRDFKVVDADLYRNLLTILNHDLEDLGLDLTFTVETEEGHGQAIELVPGGKGIDVTNENKVEYVRLIAHHRMTSSVRAQIDAFLKGFYEIIPPELISIFNPQELELLLGGMPEIDIDDMQGHCTYNNYNTSDAIIRNFWSVLRRFSREDKALFVQFLTGSSKVPLDGFSALVTSEGSRGIAIHKAYDVNLLPTAHTCFNQLDLPEYPDEETLREKLLVVLRHGAEGFGFA